MRVGLIQTGKVFNRIKVWPPSLIKENCDTLADVGLGFPSLLVFGLEYTTTLFVLYHLLSLNNLELVWLLKYFYNSLMTPITPLIVSILLETPWKILCDSDKISITEKGDMSFIHSTNDFKSYHIFTEITVGINKMAMNQRLLGSWFFSYSIRFACLTPSLLNTLFYQIQISKPASRESRWDSYMLL